MYVYVCTYVISDFSFLTESGRILGEGYSRGGLIKKLTFQVGGGGGGGA